MSYQISILFLLFSCLPGVPSLQNSRPEDQVFQLTAIEVSGLKRFTREQVVSLTGLQIGHPVSLSELRSGAERLNQTGLFAKAGYRYTFTGDKLQVEFQIEEKPALLPCSFDNFFWLSDKELDRILRESVFAYDGTAPESGRILDQIVRVLDAQLASRHIPGSVAHTMVSDLHEQSMGQLFRIEGADLPIVGVKVTGSKILRASDLEEKCQALVGQQYSRAFVADFEAANLVPMYRQLGHLAVRFDPPQASPAAAAGNRTPLTLVLNVNEGLAYRLKGVSWSGNSLVSSEELSSLMDIKTGELADGLRIDKCFSAVQARLGTKGLIEATLGPKMQLDDATGQVEYSVSVVEGKQFRMGNLVIAAGNNETADKLRSKWKLKPGDVYDTGYFEEFSRSVVKPLAAHGFSSETSVDREKGLVNVEIRLR